MSRKILVPVDLSDHSIEVLKGAQAIAEEKDELVVLYVIPDPSKFAGLIVPHRSTDRMREELEEEAERRMKRFVERFAPDAFCLVALGKPSDEIVRISHEEKADVIVMGSHHTSGWMDRIFSSHVREKVSRQASCPVEIVPLPFETEEELKEKPRV